MDVTSDFAFNLLATESVRPLDSVDSHAYAIDRISSMNSPQFVAASCTSNLSTDAELSEVDDEVASSAATSANEDYGSDHHSEEADSQPSASPSPAFASTPRSHCLSVGDGSPFPAAPPPIIGCNIQFVAAEAVRDVLESSLNVMRRSHSQAHGTEDNNNSSTNSARLPKLGACLCDAVTGDVSEAPVRTAPQSVVRAVCVVFVDGQVKDTEYSFPVPGAHSQLLTSAEEDRSAAFGDDPHANDPASVESHDSDAVRDNPHADDPSASVEAQHGAEGGHPHADALFASVEAQHETGHPHTSDSELTGDTPHASGPPASVEAHEPEAEGGNPHALFASGEAQHEPEGGHPHTSDPAVSVEAHELAGGHPYADDPTSMRPHSRPSIDLIPPRNASMPTSAPPSNVRALKRSGRISALPLHLAEAVDAPSCVARHLVDKRAVTQQRGFGVLQPLVHSKSQFPSDHRPVLSWDDARYTYPSPQRAANGGGPPSFPLSGTPDRLPRLLDAATQCSPVSVHCAFAFADSPSGVELSSRPPSVFGERTTATAFSLSPQRESTFAGEEFDLMASPPGMGYFEPYQASAPTPERSGAAEDSSASREARVPPVSRVVGFALDSRASTPHNDFFEVHNNNSISNSPPPEVFESSPPTSSLIASQYSFASTARAKSEAPPCFQRAKSVAHCLGHSYGSTESDDDDDGDGVGTRDSCSSTSSPPRTDLDPSAASASHMPPVPPARAFVGSAASGINRFFGLILFSLVSFVRVLGVLPMAIRHVAPVQASALACFALFSLSLFSFSLGPVSEVFGSPREEMLLVDNNIPTVSALGARFSSVRPTNDHAHLRRIYMGVLNATYADLDALAETYAPDDDVGLLQVALAYHHLRYNAKLFTRSLDESWLNRRVLYRLRDFYVFGIRRQGLRRAVAQAMQLDLYSLIVRRGVDAIACLVQSEAHPCPSLSYAIESFENTFGMEVASDSVPAMRLLLEWVSHPDRLSADRVRALLSP